MALKLRASYTVPHDGVASSFCTTTTKIMVGLVDGRIYILNADGECLRTLQEPTGTVMNLAACNGYTLKEDFYASDDVLVSDTQTAVLRVWSIASGYVADTQRTRMKVECSYNKIAKYYVPSMATPPSSVPLRWKDVKSSRAPMTSISDSGTQ